MFYKFSKGKALLSVPNGIGDGSAYFDGSGVYAVLSAIDNLPYGSSPRTISILFYSKDYFNTPGTLFCYGKSTQNNLYGVGILMQSSNYCYVSTWGRSNTKDYKCSLSLGEWQHIVVTFDSDYQEKIYVNGQVVGSGTHSNIDTIKDTSCIGAFPYDGYYGEEILQGNIKDLNVYNRALTQDEVTQLYNKGTVTDGLVLNVPLTYGKDDESLFSSKSFVYDYSILTTSSGFDDWGYPIRYDIASEAGISYGQIRIVTPVNPTSNTWEDWVMSASSEIDSLRLAYKAFTDGNDDTGTSNCWHSTNTYPQWLQWYNTKKSIKIIQYSITNRETGGQHGAHILTWELQGSNDLQTWDILDNRSRESTQDSATEIFEVAKDKQKAYKYHRIYITRSDNGYSTIGNLIALGTFK
jgi:hypothetical protein